MCEYRSNVGGLLHCRVNLTKLITIKIQEGSRQSCKEKLPRVAATNHDDPHGWLIQMMGHPSSTTAHEEIATVKEFSRFSSRLSDGTHLTLVFQ